MCCNAMCSMFSPVTRWPSAAEGTPLRRYRNRFFAFVVLCVLFASEVSCNALLVQATRRVFVPPHPLEAAIGWSQYADVCSAIMLRPADNQGGKILGVFYCGSFLTAPTINEPTSGGRAYTSGFLGIRDVKCSLHTVKHGSLANSFVALINGANLPMRE
jgi:hypothetical protein